MNIGSWWNRALKLISYKPSNQRHAGATLARLGICNKWGLCQHVHCWMQESSVFWSQRVSRKALRHICPSKCLAFIAIFSITYFYGLRMAFCFHPQHIVIINSSLILLCWLHVRPYLPLNTLSPINIFQISDTICRIQMKMPQQLPVVFVSAQSEMLSLKFVL